MPDLLERTEYWLGQQGRLTQPMVLRPNATHDEPIGWESAFELIAEELRALDTPDSAASYTSGRASNEAAFLYQLLIRSFGANDMPDCSNVCHESSGTALVDSIGIGKGSVNVPDLEHADLIIIAGQNPGTNHPRMLSAVEKANGAKVIAVNPSPEAASCEFKNPQGFMAKSATARRSVTNSYRSVSAVTRRCSRVWSSCCSRPRTAMQTASSTATSSSGTGLVSKHTPATSAVDLDTVVAATGPTRQQIEDTAAALLSSDETIVCWVMGLTQQTHGVATMQDATNCFCCRA